MKKSGSVLEGSVAFGLLSLVSMVLSVPLAETVRNVLPKVKLRIIEAMRRLHPRMAAGRDDRFGISLRS